MRRLSFLALAAAVVAGACSDGDGQSLPDPETSTTTTTTTVPVDYSEVALAPVPTGKTPPSTRPPGPGRASIAGRVVDTSGSPVAQAIVRATYYGDPDKPEVIEALSTDDGTYRFSQVHGGRWRVRAWRTPDLATFETLTFFLAAVEDKALDLKVKFVPAVAVTSDMAPDPPLVGVPAELAVMILNQTVDAEGRVQRSPAADQEVTLSTDDDEWSLESSATQRTGSDGSARWKMSCGGEAAYEVTVTVADQEFTLTMPSCLSPASTTTTTVAPPDSTTTSTKPRR